ncbi:hypothetical protein MHU86_21846 [Fragilaria crotonensis]|nr:hypothetical protein MHU86_21846 [Fragilaria crotonensis]
MVYTYSQVRCQWIQLPTVRTYIPVSCLLTPSLDLDSCCCFEEPLRMSASRAGFPLLRRAVFFLSFLVSMDLYLRFTEPIPTNSATVNHVSTSEVSSSISAELETMQLPEKITEVFLNIGSNLDPILPPVDSGDKALTIAFEPIVGCKIKPHKHLMVVHAAVAANSGLTSMFLYNQNGESSSFSKPAFQDWWNSDTERDGHMQIVPVITLRQILSAIPSHIAIPYIKTDMQGHDFVAISAADDYLFQRNVDYVYSEIFVNNQSSYKNVRNDFCTDWWPHMKRIGYELVYLEALQRGHLDSKAATDYCSQFKGGPTVTASSVLLSEGNALWKRKGATERDFAFQTL